MLFGIVAAVEARTLSGFSSFHSVAPPSLKISCPSSGAFGNTLLSVPAKLQAKYEVSNLQAVSAKAISVTDLLVHLK